MRAPKRSFRSIHRARRLAALAVLAGLALTRAARAQESPPPPAPIDRPAAAQRIVRVFDFEERDTNPLPVPRYWLRAQEDRAIPRLRPGFPLWNEAELDYTVAASGVGSVRLPTRGGSTSLCLDAGVIPVFPEARYLASARVRTEGLVHARAALLVRLLDQSGQPLPGAEALTEPIQSPDRWRILAASLDADDPRAAYLQLELLLLQPRQFAPPTLPDPHQVWPEDLSGAAWFDDVVVAQLPRVDLATNSPTNVIAAPDVPRLSLRTRDLTGEALRARIVVQDLDGRVVDRDQRTLERGRASWSWAPRLGRFGWYRATLDLLSADLRVGSSHVDFVWLPPAPPGEPSPDGSRFGLVLDPTPDALAPHLHDLVSLSGAGAATVPIEPGAASDALLGAIDRLLAAGARVTFALSAPAAEPGTERAGAEPAGNRASPWLRALAALLDRYGQSVQRWQIAPALGPGPSRAGEATFDSIRAMVARFVPGPILALGAPADAVPTPAPGTAIAAALPSAVPPEAMPLVAESLGVASAPAPAEATIILETLDSDRFGRRDIAIDLAQRTIAFWAAFGEPTSGAPASVAIAQPWQWVERPVPRLAPGVELAVWRTLADQLRGRRIAGELPIAQGVRCYILAPTPAAGPGRTGALVAWRETAPADSATLEAVLGPGRLRAVDLFGNAAPLTPADAATGAYRLPLDATPVFVEGVDIALARFVASFCLEPPFLPTDGQSHMHEIVLYNPWSVRIDGRLTLLEPGGPAPGSLLPDDAWRISPRSMPFSIAPGDEARLPVSVACSPVEEAGPKDVVADVDLIAEREHRGLRLQNALEVGHKGLSLDVAYRALEAPGGGDLVVEAHITNRGEQPATLEVAVYVPGAARARASISELAPGASALRRFPFDGAAARRRGQRIIVSVEDVDTRARLTRSVVIH